MLPALESRAIPYRLKRTKRRSLVIHISERGEVLVTAPTRMSSELIEAYLQRKRAWIAKKVAEHEERNAKWKPHTFEAGDILYLFGKPRRLVVANGEATTVEWGEANVVVPNTWRKDRIKHELEQSLKSLARDYYQRAVSVYERKMNTRATRVWLSGAQRRWGSCNHQNGLNINWRLIMAPKGVIHSVIVHELAHTIRKDHSPAFWHIVKIHFPKYEKAKTWLRNHELMLRWHK